MIKFHRGRIKQYLGHELDVILSRPLKGRDIGDDYNFFSLPLYKNKYMVTIENLERMET